MDKIREIEEAFIKKNVTGFKVGDTIQVAVRIKEGDKTRIQNYAGIVISRKGSGTRETFTVRHISFGEGVERIFQLNSPFIDSIKVVKKGKVKRARLYYLRKKTGKHASVEEDRTADDIPQNAGLGETGVS